MAVHWTALLHKTNRLNCLSSRYFKHMHYGPLSLHTSIMYDHTYCYQRSTLCGYTCIRDISSTTSHVSLTTIIIPYIVLTTSNYVRM